MKAVSLLFLGLFCALVAAQPYTLSTIATTSQVVDATNQPLYSPSVFVEITYIPANNSFTYLLFADGTDLLAMTSIDLYVGDAKFAGTWLASIPTPTSNPVQGNVEVDSTLANVTDAANAAASNRLYISFTSGSISLRGDLSRVNTHWGGDIETSSLKGNFFFRVTGAGSESSPFTLFFYLNSKSSLPSSSAIQLFSANGTLLADLAATGNSFPLTGYRPISAWAVSELYSATSLLSVGGVPVAVVPAQETTFELDLSAAQAPAYVPPGPFGKAWLTYSLNSSLSFTVDFAGLSSATPEAAFFLKKTNGNGTFWSESLLSLTSGIQASNATRLSGSFASLPDLVRAQFLLGFATGSLTLTLSSPNFPLGEIAGSINYDKFRISAASICRGTWVLINENSVPIQFSLTKSQSKAVTNGFFLNAFAADYFTVPTGAEVFLKIAKQTQGNKQFFGKRRQNKCFLINTICTGVWNVLSNVNAPLAYTYVISYSNGTEITRGRKIFVGGGVTTQTINSLNVASPDQQIQLFTSGTHAALAASGKKQCPTSTPAKK